MSAPAPEVLEKFLAVHGLETTVDAIEPILGGYSQLSWKVTTGAGVFALRSDRPAGAGLAATDRGAEWDLLSSLTSAGAPIPAARFVDRDGSELGTPSIVSDFIEGENLLDRSRATDAAGQRDVALRLADVAAEVHRIDPSVLPPSEPVNWDGNIDQLIGVWRAVEARHPERLPFVRYLASWLDRNRPAPTALTMVHGDFSLANVMITPADEAVVVDWEYGHFGDPREDLGWALSRGLVEPPNILQDNLDAFCARYRQVSGLSEEVLNPAAVNYFAMIAAARAWGQILGGIGAMAAGANSLVLSAYLISAWDQTCAKYLEQVT